MMLLQGDPVDAHDFAFPQAVRRSRAHIPTTTNISGAKVAGSRPPRPRKSSLHEVAVVEWQATSISWCAMSQTLCVTPAGRLVIEPAPDSPFSLDDAVVAGLEASFAESSAQGLLWLASNRLKVSLPPALVFWRDFAELLFHEICHLGDDGDAAKWNQLPPPADAQLQAIIAAAPSMRGLEYLTGELLGRLWCDLRQLVVDEAQRHVGGPKEYLRGVNPIWHLLGKVTFHLAENKRDEERPFAFLATYTRRVSAGRLQHVPLGQALMDYAGEKNQARLTALLEPVRAAADESPLVREMLDSRDLFQPQPWTIREAYRFLTEVPHMEAAGVVVRLPDWWTRRQPPRPQVRVRLGQKSASQLGLDGLLDFSAELALDGEPLSESERLQLLNSSDGLLLLRGRWVEVNRRQLEEVARSLASARVAPPGRRQLRPRHAATGGRAARW